MTTLWAITNHMGNVGVVYLETSHAAAERLTDRGFYVDAAATLCQMFLVAMSGAEIYGIP